MIWTFATVKGETLTFRCIQFETEAYFDTLKIGEGNDTENADSVRAVFTGQRCYNLSTSGNKMWISFDSDSSINSFGFEGTVSVTPEKSKYSCVLIMIDSLLNRKAVQLLKCKQN